MTTAKEIAERIDWPAVVLLSYGKNPALIFGRQAIVFLPDTTEYGCEPVEMSEELQALKQSWTKWDFFELTATTIGAFLLWASRRTSELALVPGDQDAAFNVTRKEDTQLILGAPFDRALIREALQPIIELGAEADDSLTVELLRSHYDERFPMMRIECARGIAYVAGCNLPAGNDPFSGASK